MGGGVSVVKVGFLDSELCQNDQGISSLSEFFFWTNCRFADKFYLHHQGETRILLNFWLWFCTVLSGREYITSPKAKKGRWKFDLDLPNDIHVQVCSNRSSSLRVCMAFMTIIEQLQQRNPGERGCVLKKRQYFTILFKILNLI